VRGNDNTAAGVDYLQPEAAILARYDEIQQSAIAAGQELDRLKAIPQDQRTAAQTDRIAQLTELLDAINRDFRNFARSPEIRTLIAQLSYEAQEASLSLNQLDRLRDELQQLNAAIFYPLILEDRLELVITTPNAPPLRRTVPISRAELNAAILAFRTALTNPGSNAEVPAQTLYTWLIQPLEADLAEAGVETIIYAPDGQLRYIPLAALHDGDRWLIERYQVNNITAESLTDLTETDTGTPLILAAAYVDESLIYTPEVNGKTYQFRGLPGQAAKFKPYQRTPNSGDEALAYRPCGQSWMSTRCYTLPPMLPLSPASPKIPSFSLQWRYPHPAGCGELVFEWGGAGGAQCLRNRRRGSGVRGRGAGPGLPIPNQWGQGGPGFPLAGKRFRHPGPHGRFLRWSASRHDQG
jgi:hypothetical protein